MATTNRSFPSATKWLFYRLPPIVGGIGVLIFMVKDELSTYLPSLNRFVSVVTDHTAAAFAGFVVFLFLCAGIWWVADVFDRPDIWRAN